MQRLFVGIASVAICALVALSAIDAMENQARIDESNQGLATFDRSRADIDPTIYQSYIGRYQLDPRFNIEISSDGEKLYAQGTGQRRVELFPANKNTFYNKYTEALITFESPTDGSSQRFMLQQINQLREGVRLHEV